ncbi:heterokaryon incompatibility protein-domain-containing protein [Echria macrotheca]|uniref:Heterokaryon incompatibility protein-domain-containing protein n=1 Tax=Echria macrotheca TaxID=438768 RepID=A0AAJ0B2L6_9PEZI|nr:heterokaryon incompatibility protein-domain-containing protein [Echria macrotheca]
MAGFPSKFLQRLFTTTTNALQPDEPFVIRDVPFVFLAAILAVSGLAAVFLLLFLWFMRNTMASLVSNLSTWLGEALPGLGPIVYAASFGYLTVQPPRFREPDIFSHSNLCRNCEDAVRASALLCGRRGRLVRTVEKIPLFDSLDEMQRSWSGCQLCEALLSNKKQDDAQVPEVRGYGTMNTPVPSGRPRRRLFLRLTYRRSSSRLSQGLLTACLDDATGVTEFTDIAISTGPLKESGLRDPARNDSWLFTGSHPTLDKVARWIRTCSETHESCQLTESDTGFLPSRLLFVGSMSEPALRVVETKTDSLDEQNSRYVALSHCWGGQVSCQLTAQNYSGMRDSISPDVLPQNFRDAVLVTRHLGIPYLWIDSLCILQDSLADWAAESPTMGLVFARAVVVIAATASENAHGGCFRTLPAPTYELELMRSEKAREQCYISFGPHRSSVRTLFDTRVETAPLTKRAWAFQERLLSRRLVHFCSDMVLFECNSIQASEFDPVGVSYEKEPYAIREGRIISWFEHTLLDPLVRMTRLGGLDVSEKDRARRGIRGALDVLQLLGRVPDQPTLAERVEFSKRWFDIVSAYSEGALTRQTDKLVAVSGVAALVQTHARVPYLAGLWDANSVLEMQLLWFVVGNVHPKTEPYCAPSWSWAAVNGRIGLLPRDDLQTTRLRSESIVFRAQVRKSAVFYKDMEVEDATNLIDFGSLSLSGPTADVTLRANTLETLYLTLKGGILGLGVALEFFPDYDPGDIEEAWATSQLYALRLLTIRHSDRQERHYGIVLRVKSRTVRPRREATRFMFTRGFGSDSDSDDDDDIVYERIGVWTATGDIGGGNINGPPSSRASSSLTGGGGPRWKRRDVTVV